MKRKYILIIAACVGLLAVFITWTLLYQQHLRSVEIGKEDIIAYNDSVEKTENIRNMRLDSLQRDFDDTEKSSMLKASDFITTRRETTSVADPDSETETVTTALIAEPNTFLSSVLARKGFRLVDSRASRVRGADGEFYPVKCDIYERLFKNIGYINVTILNGYGGFIRIYFPNRDYADNFINECKRLGYEAENSNSNVYRIPMKYTEDGEEKVTANPLHKNGYMKITHKGVSEIEISTGNQNSN